MADTLVIIAPDMRNGGSVGAVAWRHAIELSRSHEVHVITRAIPIGARDCIDPIIVQHRTWNWLHRFSHVPNEMSFLGAAQRSLRTLCGHAKIDLVWCHSHSTAALVAAPSQRRFGYQVVMTMHGDIFDRPPKTYSRELTWFYKWVTPRAYRQADGVQALSPYMADCAVKGGARRDRIRVIPNGIDAQEVGAGALAPRPADSFVPEGTLRLLYVGSLWKPKGVDMLLRAVARFFPAHAAVSGCVRDRAFRKVILTLIGEGRQRSQLEQLVATLGLAGQVRFLGHVSRRDLVGHYQQADILCVPSISEALSIVTLEGMLCGLPVVGSNTGGIPFLVEPGVNGYLAASGDEGSLAAAIIAAASSRAHLAELGGHGFLMARHNFAWPEVAEQLNAFVHDTVWRKNGHAGS